MFKWYNNVVATNVANWNISLGSNVITP